MAKVMRVIDTSKCVGCKGCQVACKQWNQLPAVETEFTGSYENPADFTPETWCRVKFNEYENGDNINWYFSFYSCMHCTEAACIDICPVDAIVRADNGAVRIHQETCIACGACTGACPFDVPRVAEKAFKCTFCADRVDNGLIPACAKTCPTGAISFGDADEKLAEAEARVSQLQDMGHANAQIYGKDELGGLKSVYVLLDSPDMYGMPVDPTVSFGTYLWKVAMGPIKTVAAVGLAAGALSSWFAVRKEEVKKEKEAEVEAKK